MEVQSYTLCLKEGVIYILCRAEKWIGAFRPHIRILFLSFLLYSVDQNLIIIRGEQKQMKFENKQNTKNILAESFK